MYKHVRLGALFVFGGLATLVATASTAWSCASLAAVEITPGVVRPGQEVTVKGTFFNKDKPVTILWGGLNGPVLTTLDPAVPGVFTEGLHGNWRFATGTMTIPADATPGTYIVVANQEAAKGTATWGVPARTLVRVSDGSPLLAQNPDPPVVDRPTTLIEQDALSSGDFLLVLLGAAGVTLLVAGAGIVVAAGRRPRAVPAAVRPSSRP